MNCFGGCGNNGNAFGGDSCLLLILLLCCCGGCGNNGGDGFVMARVAAKEGAAANR